MKGHRLHTLPVSMDNRGMERLLTVHQADNTEMDHKTVANNNANSDAFPFSEADLCAKKGLEGRRQGSEECTGTGLFMKQRG